MNKKHLAFPISMFFLVFAISIAISLSGHKSLDLGSLLFIVFCSVVPGVVYLGVLRMKKANRPE